MYSTQTNKVNIKMFAKQCISMFSHMAYINQFLPLLKAVYSHSVFFTECI
jgi:hypothetical protein